MKIMCMQNHMIACFQEASTVVAQLNLHKNYIHNIEKRSIK